MKSLLGVLFVLLFFAAVTDISGDGGYPLVGGRTRGSFMHGCWGWWPSMANYGFGGFIMWFILIVLAALVIYLIIKTQKLNRQRIGGSYGQEPPLEIAKRRYARGEVTREEYEQIKKDLSQ